MMSTGHIILQIIWDMYKGNYSNNKSTREENVYNGEEGNNDSCIFQKKRSFFNRMNIKYTHMTHTRLTQGCRNVIAHLFKTLVQTTQKI